jgi:hypothetical protein
MKTRFSIILSGAILMITAQTLSAQGQDSIQTYVNPYGKLVLTNLVDRPQTRPIPSVLQSTDSLAQEMPAPLRALVDAISANHGMDPALVRAVMKTESNFNRWAVSNKGALGLMQLIPSTGRRYGVRDFFDPQQNIDGGVRYLKFLLQKFHGDVDLSLAAYNAGENLVERLGRVPPIPETANYVRKVRAIYKRKSAPVVVSTSSPELAAESALPPQPSAASQPQAPLQAPAPEPAKLYKMVDSRGVVHFSNIEPPN